MRYKLLGRSGLRVSELCLGTMTFGVEHWGTAESDAAAIYGRFRDTGGNFLDTANEIYAGGRSEEILGRLVAGHRDEVVLASKYTLAMPGGRNPNMAGNHRKSLMRSLEASLRRLQTDYIDLMWVHAWDAVTPADEVMRALDDAVTQGKILYIGASNVPAWIVAQCNTLADCRGWTPFVALQIEYSLVERAAEHELLPMARELQLGVAAWSPLAGGILSGKYGTQADGESKRLDSMKFRTLDEPSRVIAAMVSEVAGAIGRRPSQVALNWLRAKAGVMPILGVRTLRQLEENLGCLDFELNAEQLSRLDRQGAPAELYPSSYLSRAQPVLHGGFQNALDRRWPR